MAKKDKQAKKDKPGGTAADAVDAIRSAIERAGLTEKRQREVVDQVTAAAGRIRQTLDDLKVVDEVHDLRKQLETLAARVAELEGAARTRVTGAARAATSRATNTGGTRSAASKPASTRSAASKPASTRSTSARASSTAKKPASTRAKPAAKPAAKSTTAKPRTTRARPKPPGGSSGGAGGSSGGSSS